MKTKAVLISSDDALPRSSMENIERDTSSDVSESLSRFVERVENGDESLGRGRDDQSQRSSDEREEE